MMLLALLSVCLLSLESVNSEVLVGELPTWGHQVRGNLYIIDQSTMVIRQFYYDSGGPDAHLYWYRVDNVPPFIASEVRFHYRSGGGKRIRHPDSTRPDGRFPTGAFVSNETLQFSLPEDVYACDMAVFTIWCRQASTHFTGIDIPASLFTTDANEAADGSKILCTREEIPEEPEDNETDPPSEVCAGSLPDLYHGVQGQLCFIDQSTMVIRGFYYDTQGPDAYLYWYPTGNDPPYTAANVQTDYREGGGFIIPHPQTNNRALPYDTGGIENQTLQFDLPSGVYGCDMAVFTIWCQQAGVQFSALDISPDLFTSDASEAATGDKILCTRESNDTDTTDSTPPVDRPTTDDFENCEQLDESLSLSWTVDRPSESVTFMLCGCTFSNREEENIWLGFGLSGSSDETVMRGADVSIVWVDEVEGPQAVDYYLSEYTQCRGGIGACPDTFDSSGECSNDVTLLQGFRQDGQQCVVFSRNITEGDECDLKLDPDLEEQYIVWGIGGLGETAFRHFIRADRGDPPLHLGRGSLKNCEPLQCISCPAYQNQRMTAPSDTTFVAHIGPSGDQRGYMAITNQAGWGITWYINGTLIPELVLTRGQTYTFVVYGGDDPMDPARYHPFYITSSSSGGLLLNQNQNQEETVYAGFDGQNPIGVGPLCEYKSNAEATAVLMKCDSDLSEYEGTLTSPDSKCGDDTTKNVFTWKPDENTPKLVYYQCASHLNLGWKIIVTDPDVAGFESASLTVHASFALSLLSLTITYMLY